jgi:hypothetical protein
MKVERANIRVKLKTIMKEDEAEYFPLVVATSPTKPKRTKNATGPKKRKQADSKPKRKQKKLKVLFTGVRNMSNQSLR